MKQHDQAELISRKQMTPGKRCSISLLTNDLYYNYNVAPFYTHYLTSIKKVLAKMGIHEDSHNLLVGI